jgi:hypothetical protein
MTIEELQERLRLSAPAELPMINDDELDISDDPVL